MESVLMTDGYQRAVAGSAPWALPLAPRQVRTVAAAPVARWLLVDEGCVWVTQRRSDQPAEDIWLQAGESLALPAGTAWIVEAWPRAQLSLLKAMPELSRGAAWPPLAAWWAALLRRPPAAVHARA